MKSSRRSWQVQNLLPKPLYDSLRRSRVGTAWGEFRRIQLQRQYDQRREHYRSIAETRGLRYNEDASISAVRARLSARGVRPIARKMGEIHTFAFVPKVGWHDALLPDLMELGPVSDFDCAPAGCQWADLYRRDRGFIERRQRINDLFLEELIKAHAQKPVDWVFIYASGWEILAETLKAVVKEVGVPLVNMCLDDKQSWTGPVIGGQRLGQIDIAPNFDLSWTSARVSCEWYMAEGCRPLYLPEGFDSSRFRPMPEPKTIPVSFIGAAYGFRPAVIRFLKQHGVDVHSYGPGWENGGVWGGEQVRVINRSAINLGFGGIGYSEDLTNVKTRDFEIPGAGGGLYITSFNSDLAQHFDIGREIVCYRNRDEMLEQIRYYLDRPDEAAGIAMRARLRCLADHRWLNRYAKVCRALGVLKE